MAKPKKTEAELSVLVRPDCKRVFIAAKYDLRQQYDLLAYD